MSASALLVPPGSSSTTPTQPSNRSPSSPPDITNKKASLDFICSPTVDPSSSHVDHIPSPPFVQGQASAAPPVQSISTTSIPAKRKAKSLSKLESLPRSLLSHIAFQLVIQESSPDPKWTGRKHPSSLLPFFLSSRTVYDAISFDNNPQLYNHLFRATFDTSALTRRYDWMVKNLSQQAGRGRKIFDLFSDPRSWAIDYRTRWEQSARMRKVVKANKFDGLCDKDQLVADLWNVWFLLTENDGRNIQFLVKECGFEAWIYVFYREDMLKDSLMPGYPRESGEKALATWCALLSGADLSSEQTPAEVDEKIFVMRPYVFACAKYDITYAPWHYRHLPLGGPGGKNPTPDVPIRSKALPYKRFGYTWRRAPPHFVLGIYLTFLRLLERQPGRMGLKPGSSTFASLAGSGPVPGLFSITRILPSIYHDREWQRNTVCQDPLSSPGLPALTFRGEIEGFWRAKFLFYDFDLYREILAGNIRGVYTGTFAEQATELELKETVIKVRKEDVGGKGPLLCAGFDAEQEGHNPEEEQQRIRDGYGHELVQDEHEVDEEGWTKEILISGMARTSWGDCTVRGRIRAWDGLVIMSIAYTTIAMGRWLWRGYLHTGGHLIGRWRDTFTPENLRGYEGAFGMIRAGDVFYPPQYPTQMPDSLGVNQADALPGANGAGAPISFPSQNLTAQGYPHPTGPPAQSPPSSAGSPPGLPGQSGPTGSLLPPLSAVSPSGISAANVGEIVERTASSSRPSAGPTWRTSPPSPIIGTSRDRRDSSARMQESNVRDERG